MSSRNTLLVSSRNTPLVSSRNIPLVSFLNIPLLTSRNSPRLINSTQPLLAQEFVCPENNRIPFARLQKTTENRFISNKSRKCFQSKGLETENAKNTSKLSLSVVCENATRSSTGTSPSFKIQESKIYDLCRERDFLFLFQLSQSFSKAVTNSFERAP